MDTTPLLRQALYRLFAWLFLYPEEKRLNTLRQGAGELLENQPLWETEPYAGVLRSLLERLVTLDEQAAAGLTREYTHLFAVKAVADPYESLYTTPHAEARGWVITQLERVYGRHGLVVSGLNELPDHLAVELEFLSYLCDQEASASQAGDAVAALKFVTAQESFLEKHLLRWAPRLSQKVFDSMPDSMYGLVMSALMGFLGG
jgi:DMSO reductase family type II enzyme chaperone